MYKKKQHLKHWLFGLDRWKKTLFQITSDSFVAIIALLLASFSQRESADFLRVFDTYIGAAIAILATIIGFKLRGLYHSLTRHTSIETTYSIAIGSTISGFTLFFGIFLLELEIARSVVVTYGALLCVMATSLRLFVRALDQRITDETSENVVIYGAGATGIQLMEALRTSSKYRVKLFIDDKPELNGKTLGGIEINSFSDAQRKFEKLEVETLLLAIPNNAEIILQQVYDFLPNHPLKVKTIPSISDLISGNLDVTKFKDINIEDLLGREPVLCNYELMAKNITKKTILVTGAGGSIGSELCRQIIKWRPKTIIMLDVSEFCVYSILEALKSSSYAEDVDLIPLVGSIQDRRFVNKIFDQFRVDTAYHAAAYKHVPLMELNVMQCISNNVFGTLNMVEASIAAKVQNFVLVSTDKAVKPSNFMGASKRLAEITCQTLPARDSYTRFSIVRFGNVLGSSGSVVPLFKKQIKNGGPITVTHPDVTRYFMTITEAAQLVIQAGSIAKGKGVFVLDMGEPIKILDLAKRMAILSGLRPIVNNDWPLQENEIKITISGLRQGEKMHEELSYNTDLIPTTHPRIYSTIEGKISKRHLQKTLSVLREAIREQNYEVVFSTISSFAPGVVNIENTKDLLWAKTVRENPAKIKIKKANQRNS